MESGEDWVVGLEPGVEEVLAGLVVEVQVLVVVVG